MSMMSFIASFLKCIGRLLKNAVIMEHNHNHQTRISGVHGRTLLLCIIINVAFVAAEAVVGICSNSTGLLSDAGHNLSDVLGIMLALVALRMEKSGSRDSGRVSRYVTLANAALLLAAVALIVKESISKIIAPEEVDGAAIMITAGVAIFVNGFTTWLLMRKNDGNINMKAAYQHAATDTLVSVGVVISGLVISLTGWSVVDPVISLVITAVIAVPAVKLFVDTVRLIKKG